MRKLLSLVVLVGFAIVDLLFFHDVLKPGESTSLPQYLTGVLSIPVMITALLELLRPRHSH